MSSHVTTQAATDDILGQFFYALGQGAGTIRIQRDAIAALRSRYAQPISSAITQWPSLAPNILSFVAQIGRVAALQTTKEGRTAISAADFTYARQLVESRVHGSGERTYGIFAGVLCPAIPGEQFPNPETNTGGPHSDPAVPRPVSIIVPATNLIQ